MLDGPSPTQAYIGSASEGILSLTSMRIFLTAFIPSPRAMAEWVLFEQLFYII
jgi:hypothetical protein